MMNQATIQPTMTMTTTMPTLDIFPCIVLLSTILFFLPLSMPLIIAYILSAFMVLISIAIQIFIQLDMSMKETTTTTTTLHRRINWQKFDRINWQIVEAYSCTSYSFLSILLCLLCCAISILWSPVIIVFVSCVDNAAATLLKELAEVKKRATEEFGWVWIEEDEEREHAIDSEYSSR